MKKSNKKRKNKINKRKSDKLGSMLIGLVVVLLCCLVGYNAISLRHKSDELASQQTSLEEKIKTAEKTSEELDAKEQYMKTKKYVEDVAEEKLGLVYKDEIIIKPEN